MKVEFVTSDMADEHGDQWATDAYTMWRGFLMQYLSWAGETEIYLALFVIYVSSSFKNFILWGIGNAQLELIFLFKWTKTVLDIGFQYRRFKFLSTFLISVQILKKANNQLDQILKITWLLFVDMH